VRVGDVWQSARLLDLSSHGVRFAGPDLRVLGPRVSLQLRVPCHLLRVSGAVVRHTADTAVDLDPLTRRETLALGAALLEAAPPVGASRGAVIVMVPDPVQQHALGDALRESGFTVIARSTPLDLLERLFDPGLPIRGAIVSPALPNGAGQDVLAFLAAERPAIRTVLADARSVSELAAAAADGALS
jgi:hypothetical protein